MANLLPYFEGNTSVSYDWFPTKWQCFVYRNWDMLTTSTLARVLCAKESEVEEAARRMGLPENSADEALWKVRGYVTLIRANWHLLTYRQLCDLLGWEESYLAYILHEDDFLDVKLGRHKPNVPELRMTPLSEEQERQTAAIRRVTEEVRARIGEQTLPPFAFSAVYPRAGELPPLPGESRFSAAYLCSYATLYGDTFADEALIEASFPDELLDSYAALGVGGVFCQAVLYSLIPCPYAPELSRGCEERIRGLNSLISRLARHGLKLYLYINEPRELPDAVFEKFPHLKGDVYHEGYASLCLSVPEVQDFLRDSIRRLTELCPGLGGYFTVTGSENHTNCYSHKAIGTTTCPRCREKAPSDLYSLVNRLVLEGATAVDPSIDVIAASWAWDSFEEDGDHKTVRLLPPEIAVWAVSERGAPRRYETAEVSVRDYSISITGPSEKTLSLWRTVREHGGRVAAKLQLGNSWELSSVPYIPAFRHFYTSIRDLCEKAAPEVVQMTWTMGGFPSPVLRLFAEMTRKDAEIPSYEELIARLFPTPETGALLRALDALDRAFDEFPFSVISMYNGPQHMGPALPLWKEPTGWRSCMVGLVYDDMATCASNHPNGIYLRQLERLTDGWREGYRLLTEAYEGKALTPADRLLLDCAESALYHFTSSRNHVRYVAARGSGEDMTALIREEEELAIREARLMQHDPCIGFEATNHYFYTRQDLFEKVLNCRHLLGEL